LIGTPASHVSAVARGLIPEDPGARLSDLAGFRNVLVHVYGKLNQDEVYGVLQDDRAAWFSSRSASIPKACRGGEDRDPAFFAGEEGGSGQEDSRSHNSRYALRR
jgi:hypothetical protein